jgi:hypothetical protein
MKRLFPLFLIFFLSSFGSFAQSSTLYWNKVMLGDGVNLASGINDIVIDQNDNYYTLHASGFSYFIDTVATSYSSDGLVLTKFNSDDRAIWSKYISETISCKLVLDNFGHPNLVGFYQDSWNILGTTIYAQGGIDGFVAKLDSNCNLVKLIAIGGACDDIVSGLCFDDDNAFYVTGMTGVYSSNQNCSTVLGNDSLLMVTKKQFLIKYDGLNNAQWTKLYNTSGSVPGEVASIGSKIVVSGIINHNNSQFTVDTVTVNIHNGQDKVAAIWDVSKNGRTTWIKVVGLTSPPPAGGKAGGGWRADIYFGGIKANTNSVFLNLPIFSDLGVTVNVQGHKYFDIFNCNTSSTSSRKTNLFLRNQR